MLCTNFIPTGSGTNINTIGIFVVASRKYVDAIAPPSAVPRIGEHDRQVVGRRAERAAQRGGRAAQGLLGVDVAAAICVVHDDRLHGEGLGRRIRPATADLGLNAATAPDPDRSPEGANLDRRVELDHAAAGGVGAGAEHDVGERLGDAEDVAVVDEPRLGVGILRAHIVRRLDHRRVVLERGGPG